MTELLAIGRFAHRTNPQLLAGSVIPAHEANVPASNTGTLNRLELLPKILGSSYTDALFEIVGEPRRFNEAQQDLKRFLDDNFRRLSTPRDVSLFARLIGFSNSVFGNWVCARIIFIHFLH